MVHPLFNEDAWCYWVISVGALFSFVGLIVACICSCRRNDNKSEFLGLAGMVTITHPDNEGFTRVTTSSEAVHTVPQDAVDGGGKRTNTANRSLPDIPKDRIAESETDVELRDVIYEVTENVGGDPSELYATVQDKNEDRRDKREKQSISQQSSQDETASLYARLKTPQTSSEEHPYAQVQNVPKTECAQHNSNNSHAVDLAKPSTSTGIGGGSLPVAPPRSRRSSSHNSLLEQPIVVDIPAATAITGGIQANQDLPYMTPPILMPPLPQPPQPQNNSPQQQHFSGDSQDSKGYTSISVREPLANIIAQTKSAQQQRQASRPITDPHYATVSDDSDEMYAAIDEQEKVYTSGSETYAQIQPMVVEVNRPPPNEPSVSIPGSSRAEEPFALAPQPPSVDSLRHVAHAHSRQASSSSATSSVANPGSPKPEKRQANSPLPPPPENPLMDMYAMIDKRNKTDDRTRGNLVAAGKSLEDMYAKVIKKKRDSVDDELSCSPGPSLLTFGVEAAAVTCTVTTTTGLNAAAAAGGSSTTTGRKLSLIEVSRASWSSHDSVEIMKRETEPAVEQHQQPEQQVRVNGESYDDEYELNHGYEAVSTTGSGKRSSVIDANYETLRPLPLPQSGAVGGAPRNGIDTMPIYSMPFKHRQVSNASSEDPGYEKVRLCKRPSTGLTCEDLDTDSEPNYESMPHESVEPNYASVACRLGADSDADPNYESVSNGDPNYESVKYMSVAQPSTSSASAEPPYERVVGYKSREDPNYERIARGAVEVIGTVETNVDTDDEQYVQV